MELSCVVGYVFVEVIIHIRMWKMELSCGWLGRSEIEKEVRMWEMDLSRVGWVWREGNIDGS